MPSTLDGVGVGGVNTYNVLVGKPDGMKRVAHITV